MWNLIAVGIKDPTAVTGVIYLLQFFVMFGSNFMAPTSTMPGWLQAVVKVNPVTHAVSTVRGLMQGDLTASGLAGGLIACAALLVLFALPTMYLYSRKQQ
jgi:ABC-2 type transport system permease protein